MAINYDLIFCEGATEIFGESLLDYMAYGRCNPEFVLEAYRNINDMYEDLKLL